MSVVRHLYIVAPVRSGTTLLSRLLDRQPGVLSLGELRRLSELRAGGQPCACGEKIEACPLWGEVCAQADREGSDLAPPRASRLRRRWSHLTCLAAARFRPDAPAPAPDTPETAFSESCLRLADCAGRTTGEGVVVDSSKLPFHFLDLYRLRPRSVQPIFVLRDGRATTWSMMKRGRLGAEEASRVWLRSVRSIAAVKALPQFRHLPFVSYEELVRDPDGVVAGLVGSPAPGQRRCSARPPHDLGGSPRLAESPADQIVVVPDVEWQHRMPRSARATFERVAGRWNRRLGYGDGLP